MEYNLYIIDSYQQARNRSGSTGSRAPSTRTTRSQAAAATSPKSTLSSLNLNSSISSTSSAGPSSQRRAAPPKIGDLTVIDLTKNEDKTIAEDDVHTPRPSDYAPAECSMPAARRNQLAAFPVVEVNPDIGMGEGENAFSRDFMAKVLGGSIQPLVVRCVHPCKKRCKYDG